MLNLRRSTNSTSTLLLEQLITQVHVIRLSRSERPLSVRIRWGDSDRRKALVIVPLDDGSTRTIEDLPIDCPEYVCFYSLSERDYTIDSIDNQLRLCREVIVHDKISEKSASIDLLESIKEKVPEAFLRTFAFILTVKRNIRQLWTYNWNPQIAKRYVVIRWSSKRFL